MMTEDRPAGALARLDDAGGGGISALAQMSDADFEYRLELLKKGRERIEKIHRTLMVEGTHYGKIPGTGDKPTLLQSGAEQLCFFYQLVPDLRVDVKYGDGISEPAVSATVTCYLHQGALEGPIVGAGVGNCNSWERKYRWRRGERACPACGSVGALLKSKTKPEWFCWAKRGGCGATFALDAPQIVEQQIGDVENPDPFDLLNTILKMAKKRALVDATKGTTGTSHLYTQDIEDMAPQGDDDPAPATSPGKQRAQQAAKAGETQRSHAGAAGADVRQCTWDGCGAQITNGALTISLNKHGRPLCPKHQKEAEKGQDIEMQPPPANPKGERRKLLDQLFAVYAEKCEAEGFESDDVTMRRHMGEILTLVRNERTHVPSRREMSDPDIQTCINWLRQNGLPDHIQGDPFEDE